MARRAPIRAAPSQRVISFLAIFEPFRAFCASMWLPWHGSLSSWTIDGRRGTGPYHITDPRVEHSWQGPVPPIPSRTRSASEGPVPAGNGAGAALGAPSKRPRPHAAVDDAVRERALALALSLVQGIGPACTLGLQIQGKLDDEAPGTVSWPSGWSFRGGCHGA